MLKIMMFRKALHAEAKLVRRKTGKVHQQTFHVRDQEPQKPEELTMMTMMQKYSTEQAAREYFEKLRWPDGPVCPHCGNTKAYPIKANKAKKIREGLYKCSKCRKTFTVTVGTVMERSRIPMNKWLLGFYMMCSSKTQVSSLQLQRQLDIKSYQAALFMSHRIRFALKEVAPKLFGSVEVDETYIGGKAKGKGRAYVKNKTPVISAVERGGEVRSKVVDKVTGKVIRDLLDSNVDRSADLNTDEAKVYIKVGKKYANHDVVNHSAKEYSRVDESGRLATTNTAEGYFGNTKRSISGTHHTISPQHTDLYMAEFDYKYNTRKMTDGERTAESIPMIEGKRITRKQMFQKRHKMNEEKKKIKKAVLGQDEMKMDANSFDAIMKGVLSLKPKPEKDIPRAKVRVVTNKVDI